jgi:5'-3' exonuclease
VDVSVTYGFLKVLGSNITKFQPSSVIVAFDNGVPDYRRKAIPEYKANRDHGDPVDYEDFTRQLNELLDILPHMGVIVVRKRCAEADDLMYHASRMVKDHAVIVTGDKDLLQAVEMGVDVYSPSKEFLYTVDNFEEEIGIDRYDYIHWRALQGDSSDNIAGIPGLGEKTATRLFQEYKSLTGITNAAMGRNPIGKLTGRIGDAIIAFGFDRICKNVYVMALYADRTGSRAAVLDAIEDFQKADEKIMKKYIMKNAFVSLLDGNFIGGMLKLKKPLITLPERIPVVCCDRKPVK